MSISATLVRETTATTGTDTITMGGAVPGYIRFQDWYTTGDITPYRIRDGNDIEEGLGTLTTGASWTMARTVIFLKIVSGVVTHFPATGLNLSGNAEVTVGPSQFNTMSPTQPYLDSSANYDRGDCTIRVIDSTTGTVANRLIVAPMSVMMPRKINSLALNVTVAAGSATLSKLGIYATAGTGLPGRLLTSVSVDVTSTGLKEVSLGTTLYLSPGHYYMAFASDSNPTISGISSNYLFLSQVYTTFSGTGVSAPYKTLSSWSDLPNPFGSPTAVSGGTFPLISWRP